MSICKACGLPVDWKRASGTGKWQCFNAGTQTDHWDACSKAKFDRIKRTGLPFADADRVAVDADGQVHRTTVNGYKTPLKPSGEQLTMVRAAVIRSPCRPSGRCRDCCPPWEVCATCPDKLQHHHQGEKHGQEANRVAAQTQ